MPEPEPVTPEPVTPEPEPVEVEIPDNEQPDPLAELRKEFDEKLIAFRNEFTPRKEETTNVSQEQDSPEPEPAPIPRPTGNRFARKRG